MTEALRFTHKPLEVTAMRWDGHVRVGHPVAKWIKNNGGEYSYTPGKPQHIEVVTSRGVLSVDPGDWIVRDLNGDFSVCNEYLFALSYDPATVRCESCSASWPVEVLNDGWCPRCIEHGGE